jgi:hypothetical protein
MLPLLHNVAAQLQACTQTPPGMVLLHTKTWPAGHFLARHVTGIWKGLQVGVLLGEAQTQVLPLRHETAAQLQGGGIHVPVGKVELQTYVLSAAHLIARQVVEDSLALHMGVLLGEAQTQTLPVGHDIAAQLQGGGIHVPVGKVELQT